MVIEKHCPKCGADKPLTSEFWFRNKTQDDGFNSYCKPCWYAYMKARGRHDSPEAHERALKHLSEFGKANRARLTAKQKEWAHANIERVRARKRRYFAEDPERVLTRHQVWRNRLKLEVFEQYGGAWCACCSESTFEMLTLDHVNNDGAADRKEAKRRKVGTVIYAWVKKNDWPTGFQVLCWNCNLGKYYNGGICCPHERGRLKLVND